MQNRICLAYGQRKNYNEALNRELFWDIEEKNLYIRWGNDWLPIAGDCKNWTLAPGSSIEINPIPNEYPEKYEIRLKDDIDINTMKLGKFSTIPRWKGMRKLGEVSNTSFFPILKAKQDQSEIIGGKFFVKTTRQNYTEYGIYQATLCSEGFANIFGSDDQNVKNTINYCAFPDGKKEIGFKTFSALEEIVEYEKIENPNYQLTREIFFIIYSREDIRFASTEGGSVKFTRRGDIWSTGNSGIGGESVTSCAWYELSMKDFRDITGIVSNAGLSLDQYDNNSWVYFDIYINNEETAFSIDRAFITKQRAMNDDEIVSDGRIWCHNPNWMIPNDQHKVAVGDSFKFISNVFDDSSSNLTFVKGQKYKIMDVYANIKGSTIVIAHKRTEFLPPKKIEIWFNGWDTRLKENLPSLENREDNYDQSLILARS